MAFWKTEKKTKRQHRMPDGPTYSIRNGILIPIGIVIVLQFVLLFAGIRGSGLMRQLDQTTLRNLQQTVSARTDYLQYDMVNRWRNVDATVSVLNTIFGACEAEGYTGETLQQDSAAYVPFLKRAMPELVAMMRRNAVTGAYLILCSGDLPEDVNASTQMPGIYLRDRDPLSSYTKENSDLMLERAPLDVTSSLSISTDIGWKPMFSMSEARSNEKAFFYPYRAALKYPGEKYYNLSYWSRPYQLEGDTYTAISYSVPLIGSDGTLYGVLGVEILTDYIQRQLPAAELADGEGTYVLCIRDEHGGLSPILVSAGDSHYDLSTFAGMTAIQNQDMDYYDVTTEKLKDLYACRNQFTLYNNNTPYAGDQWLMFAVAPKSQLTALSSHVINTLLRVLLVALAATAVAILYISFRLSRPIARLEREVRLGTGRSAPVTLTHTGITELDSLAQGVEMLNAEVLRNAGKLSRILEMSSTNLGAYELDTAADTVYASEGFFRVFGRPDIRSYGMSGVEFDHLLHSYDKNVLPDTVREEDGYHECVYELRRQNEMLWVRLKTIRRGTVITGLAEDITREWLELRKLEFERDHDALTGIYNRRAFSEKLEFLFESRTELGCAALIMMDLDNLKYINDTYGHDYGDKYIRTAGHILAACSPKNALTARMSGDEFLLFVYGYSSRAEAQKAIGDLKTQLHVRHLALPDGTNTFIRASAGVAWYPADATDPNMLVRYADFAMYIGKHSTKGTFVDFNHETYAKEAYLLQGKENLNQLVEQQLVRYYFQPILEAKTGRIIAYEALMRPQMADLKNPMDVLRLARQESKLGAIEHMTWFMAMEAFTVFCAKGKVEDTCRIFINSISNQILPEEDALAFEQQYKKWLPRIVQEHTEEEQSNPALLRKKLERLHHWNAKLALDDYGSGYNGENVLIATAPDYVKVDMAIVRGVDTDSNKRELIGSLVAYAKPRGIRVIAEGVETEAEVREVLRLGVEYLQGYYVARPSAEPPALDPEHLNIIRDASASL